jgi:curli production assembly/transport component CsgF
MPINPSFGGNPNNAPGLMSIAQAQNGFTAPVLSPLESFNLNLQRSILSRLNSQALTSMFGVNNTLQTGHFDTAGYTIDVANTVGVASSLTITTTDKTTGAATTFIIETPSVTQ